MALAMETAAKNAESLQGSASYAGDTHKPTLHMMQTEETVLPKKGSSGSCYRRSHTAHKAAQCLYKEAKCHGCGKVGHLKVCRKAAKGDKSRKQARLKMVADAAPHHS